MFLVPSLPSGVVGTLDGPEGHHAATVRRLRVGEELTLGDGKGSTATAVVTAVGRGTLDLRVMTRRYSPAPDPALTVVQGIAKGDRGELAVQAMTEAGVDTIVPWAAVRSVVQWRGDRGERARQRWVDTAREAAKQSERAWLPSVAPLMSTKDIAARPWSALLVLDSTAVPQLSTVDLPATGEIAVVIGPEGGITPDELDQLVAAGGVPVRLGDTVLRTSTAGVAALAVLSARLGRW